MWQGLGWRHADVASAGCASRRPRRRGAAPTVNGIDHVATASIGVTYAKLARAGHTGHTGRVTADEVLQDADAATYRAKDLGKDRYEVFERSRPRSIPLDRAELASVEGK